MDLNAANTIGYVNWTLGYQATVLYGIPDITAPSMEALATKMRNANSQEFRSYVNWYNTNGAKDFSCDAGCHKSVMCGLGNLELSTYSACLKSQNVSNFFSVVRKIIKQVMPFSLETAVKNTCMCY
jgi:GH24 family phage-related lysozyme (muramidase)